MNLNDDMNVWNVDVQADLGRILGSLLHSGDKLKDKEFLRGLFLVVSEHLVEFGKIFGATTPEVAKQMPDFFEKRVEEYRRSMRIRQIIGFRSSASIEQEATQLAWNDTVMMMGQVCAIQDASLRGMVDDHREALRILLQTLVRLVESDAPSTEDVRRIIRKQLGDGGEA